MKLAFICTEKLPVPPVAGGAIQIYIQGILPILSKKYDITVYCLSHKSLPDEEIKDGVHYIRVKGRTKDEYINNIKKHIQQSSYDVIHVFNRPKWVLRLLNSAPNSKFTLSLHNSMFLPKKVDSVRAKKIIKNVHFICTVSKFIADEVAQLYPEAASKLFPIYSGVILNQYKTIWDDKNDKRITLRKKLNINDKKVVLFIGRLCKKKGTHIVMNAIKKVMDTRNDIAAVFVGSKWYGKNQTDDFITKLQLMSNELKGPVIFTGFLPPKVIPDYYSIGDIFVCASQWDEPLARIHYEAMAAGLPIITTNRGGNKEVINNKNGFYINEYDNPDLFADKITYLLNNSEVRENMGREGRKLVEQVYNLNRTANQLLELFEPLDDFFTFI
ncbi:glycosyltransferase family 4 protein [Abyssisolibacter fermentans]|uniref:glycosyltransferase family 4 protein n=1 Tax=Abyssisolibacter fermentans TaxID=1766203 RepID=UPI000836151A|nr:glycosyltransferase family 4 protein [Abyssisolibacter fermentans]